MRLALITGFLVAVVVTGWPAGRPETGDPVRIVLDGPERRYLSPRGDESLLEIAPGIVPPGAAIESLTFSVYGASAPFVGELVFRREYRRGPFGIRLPAALAWDATFRGSTVGVDGEPVPDGDYTYEVAVTEPSGRVSRTPPLPVVVDTRPPMIASVSAEYDVFHPTGDGSRDSVRIFQRGSHEQQWIGRVRNEAGITVREYATVDSTPPDIEWDGRTDDGAPVPDGRYEYVLAGVDRAGNRSESDPVVLVVHTRLNGVRLSPHATVAPAADRGEPGPVTYDVTISGPSDVVAWQFELTQPAADAVARPAAPVLTQEGDGAPPAQLVLDGRDADGRALAEGEYEAALTVEYRSGVRARSAAVPYIVDLTAPHGRIVAQTVPSPTAAGHDFVFGGAAREAVEFSALVSDDRWALHVEQDGRTERLPLSHLGISGEELSYRWDGRDLAGRPMSDGRYVISLHGIDAAGNTGATNEVRVVKDSRASSATIAARPDRFSPLADGASASVSLTPRIHPSDRVASARLEIIDRDGRVVRRWTDALHDHRYEWSGRTDVGATAPDGAYTARLEVLHANGNRAVATTGPIVLDTRPPEVHQLAAPYLVVRPTGDGYRETVRILQWTSGARWTARIVDSQGRLVLERRWDDRAEDFTWDARDERGRLVGDGEYRYELLGRDEVGNLTRAELALVVDTTSLPALRRPPEVSISAVPHPFVPSVDRPGQVLTLSLDASGPNEAASWSVEVSDGTGLVVRTFRGSGAPPPELAWDGRYADGRYVESASAYRAALTVTDVYGNRGEAAVRIETGVLVLRDGLLPRVMVPGIVFPPAGADLLAGNEEDVRRNLDALRSLSEVLRRSPKHEILVEGHASSDEFEEPPGGGAAGREQLVELSAMRAQSVRRALIVLGVEAGRISVAGYGDARPVVPPEDRRNSWKNRRVEFILR